MCAFFFVQSVPYCTVTGQHTGTAHRFACANDVGSMASACSVSASPRFMEAAHVFVASPSSIELIAAWLLVYQGSL
jgi:hypothetical protein